VAPKLRTVEQIIRRFADRAHGIVSRKELLGARVSTDEIRERVESDALVAVFRGVYRTGPLTTEARYIAAVKACGEGALLSGAAAAHLFGLIKGKPPPPHVTTRTERDIKGIATRRSPTICDRHATRWRGIPVTTVPQILVDLAADLGFDDLARACHEAHVRGTRPEHVEPLLGRSRGAGRLRAILRGDAPTVLSKLERGFLARLREHGLPLPKTNVNITGGYVDCRWPEHHLTVELDSYRFHNSRHAFEQDRRREREAYARRDQHRRYTYGDVFEDPTLMLSELRDLLQSDSDFFRSQGEPHRHGQDHRNRPGHDQLVHGGPRGR
jgi:hypothetical protein